MTVQEVQHALTYSSNSPFYIRSHIVVPNVYWGLGFRYELDLLSISIPAYIGTEIEIKISKGDLKRDKDKTHCHDDNRIRQLYFAGPIELQEAFFEYAPKEAGIITIFYDKKERFINRQYQCSIRRNAKPRKNFMPFTDKEVFALMRLGNMRYWSLFSKQFRSGPC
jgi:hypothetical protein